MNEHTSATYTYTTVTTQHETTDLFTPFKATVNCMSVCEGGCGCVYEGLETSAPPLRELVLK